MDGKLLAQDMELDEEFSRRIEEELSEEYIIELMEEYEDE
jgi:hypothetical protein